MIEAHHDPRSTLEGLLRFQVEAAIRAREFLTVVVGGTGVQWDACRGGRSGRTIASRCGRVVARVLGAGHGRSRPGGDHAAAAGHGDLGFVQPAEMPPLTLMT